MPESLQLAGTVMRATARFHPDQAGRQPGEERCYLVASQLLAQHRLAVFIHNTVGLKGILCQIEADSRNLHSGRSFPVEWLMTVHSGTFLMPLSGGGVHPIAYEALKSLGRPFTVIGGAAEAAELEAMRAIRQEMDAGLAV